MELQPQAQMLVLALNAQTITTSLTTAPIIQTAVLERRSVQPGCCGQTYGIGVRLDVCGDCTCGVVNLVG